MQTSLQSEIQSNDEIIGRRKTLMVLFVIAVSLFWASLYFYVPTLPVYVQTKVTTLGMVGTILSMYGLWQAVIRLPLGIAADWLGWRKPFILGGFILSALGAWIMMQASSATGLLVGRGITGLAAGTWVPLMVMFNALYPPEDAVKATAILTIANSSGMLLATLSTGWLNQVGGYALPFIVSIGSAALAFFVILSVRETRRPPKIQTASSILQLTTRPDVLRPSILAALGQYASWAATLSFTPILAHQMGATGWMSSILVSGSMATSTLGNLVTVKLARRVNRGRLILVAFIVLASSIILAAISPTFVWLLIAQCATGFSTGLMMPVLMGLSIEKVDESQRNTAMGLHQAVYGFGMFAGPSLSGFLADWLGIRQMFWVTGIICIVLGLFGSRWLLHND